MIFDSNSGEKAFKIVPLTWNIETESEERIRLFERIEEVSMTERWGDLFLSTLSPLYCPGDLFDGRKRLSFHHMTKIMT